MTNEEMFAKACVALADEGMDQQPCWVRSEVYGSRVILRNVNGDLGEFVFDKTGWPHRDKRAGVA